MSDYAKERTLVESLLYKLSPSALDRWNTCKASHRFMAYKGKQLLLFVMVGDKPRITDRLTLVNVSVDMQDGLSSTWARANGDLILIGHVPAEVAPSVFMWHTFHSEVQYVPHNSTFGIRLPLVYKTRHNLNHIMPATTYLMEKATFDAEFPT